VTDLLFWFLISQTLAGLPDMQPGTTVQLVSTDLLTVYAMAQVNERELVFQGELYAGSEVRVLIFLPNSGPRATVEALGHKALYARVSSDGTDILVQFESLDGPLSFRKWLAEERGITLVMPAESRE
jgi:hypothetical protein